jgi:hypothetical protein
MIINKQTVVRHLHTYTQNAPTNDKPQFRKHTCWPNDRAVRLVSVGRGVTLRFREGLARATSKMAPTNH